MNRCREANCRDVQMGPGQQQGCSDAPRATGGIFRYTQGQQEDLQLVLGQEQVLACPCRLPYPFQGLPATHGMLFIAKQDWHTRHVCVLKLM